MLPYGHLCAPHVLAVGPPTLCRLSVHVDKYLQFHSNISGLHMTITFMTVHKCNIHACIALLVYSGSVVRKNTICESCLTDICMPRM